MKLVQSLRTVATFGVAAMVMSAWAAKDGQPESHHSVGSTSVQMAQATPPASPAPAMQGMPNMDAQMKAMREMHDKMMAAKTPQERNALMAEHMKVMQNGMNMMGGMGTGAMKGKPGDVAARQGMLEQRMEMMQSMMQMMMDRMQSVPAAK